MSSRAGWGTWLALVVCLGLPGAGCSSRPGLVPEQEAGSYLFPPDNPRIRYVRSLRTPADAGIRAGRLRRMLAALAGASTPRIVRPSGVAVDGGVTAIADAAAGVVHVLDAGAGYRAIRKVGQRRLLAPTAVAVAGETLYITDSTARLAVRVATDGRFLGHLGAPGELSRPTGIAVDARRGRVYVTDTGSHQLVVYDPSGRRLRTVGERGRGPGQFNYPTHVAVGPDGEVAVSDALNFRVQIFTPALEFHHAIGAAGDGPGSFARPKGVAFDSDRHLYVADALFDNIQIFDAGGRLLLAFGSTGVGPGEFRMPTALCIDAHDRVLVADYLGARVAIFDYLGAAGLRGERPRAAGAALRAEAAR